MRKNLDMMNLQAFQDFFNDETIYKPSDIKELLPLVRHYFRFAQCPNKDIRYFDVPCAFDIETTSFIDSEGEKTAIMYEWTFGIFGAVIIGRTWDEYIEVIDYISDVLCLNSNKRLIVFVHNLSFEFSFLQKRHEYENVFAIKSRTPIYALTSTGVEYRCSYLLSGYSLDKLSSQLQHFKIRKLSGQLDYEKMRHSKTLLKENEIAYCVSDVKVVLAYIAERIIADGNIAKIPLTKTGYVRNYCRNSCFYDSDKPKKKSLKRLKYKEIMQSMTLTLEEYLQLKRAFQGGFTHANPFYSGKTLENVTSYDFTSSYPTVMLAEKFPMDRGELYTPKSKDDFEKCLKLYCCVFDVEIYDLNSVLFFENYLSISRCRKVESAVVENGRVVSAKHLITTMTEQDYMIMRKFYTWNREKSKISNFRRYKKDYLPTDFVKAILKLYQDKTTLKGVKGREYDYLVSKEMLNSTYGMCVTDIIRDLVIFDGHWLTSDELPEQNYEDEIRKYNESKSRFLFYPWGVWVTAYARRNLFTGIIEFAEDYIYSDTDSIKCLNADAHKDYIDKYNSMIIKQLENAMEYHGIDKRTIKPKTVKGIEKPLGVWDYEGTYDRFKTLGAKRYLTQGKDGEITLTVAGLNKRKAVMYLCNGWSYTISGEEENSPFEKFNANLHVPESDTGKMTHTYIDTARDGVLTDCNGISAEYHELTSVHLSKSDYSLSMSQEYADYMLGINYEYL